MTYEIVKSIKWKGYSFKEKGAPEPDYSGLPDRAKAALTAVFEVLHTFEAPDRIAAQLYYDRWLLEHIIKIDPDTVMVENVLDFGDAS